ILGEETGDGQRGAGKVGIRVGEGDIAVDELGRRVDRVLQKGRRIEARKRGNGTHEATCYDWLERTAGGWRAAMRAPAQTGHFGSTGTGTRNRSDRPWRRFAA